LLAIRLKPKQKSGKPLDLLDLIGLAGIGWREATLEEVLTQKKNAFYLAIS